MWLLWSGALLGAIFSKVLDMVAFLARYQLGCLDYINDPVCFFRTAGWVLLVFGFLGLIIMAAFAPILKRIYKSGSWT